MLSTIGLILEIGKILLSAAPTIYKLWVELMAAIHPTPEAGNAESHAVAKSTARAILPVLDAGTQQQVQAVLDKYGDLPEQAFINA